MPLSKAQISRLRGLRLKKNREDESCYVVEGPKVVAELLAAGQPLSEIYATPDWTEPDASPPVAVMRITATEMRRISHFPTPSTVLAVGRLARSELAAGEIRRVEVEGREPIAVYNVDGQFYATDDNCSHKWASLATGWLEGHVVVCPWHGGAHDVRDGRAVGPPCVRPLRTWPVPAAPNSPSN